MSSSGAVLQGSVNPNGRAATATFQYGTAAGVYGLNAQSALAPSNGSVAQNVNATISGLAPSTTYHFRMSGGSAFGRASGGDVTFTTLAGPDIAVEQPAGRLLTGGTSVMNFVAVVGASITKTFTIRNTGTLNLTSLAISSAGVNVADFSITTPGATTLAPGGSTTFDVTFNASTPGVKTAALHITSNDPDESPFDINLIGTGAP